MLQEGASDLLFRILENEPIAVLCGAGVSRNSGIPRVDPFVNYFLTKLEMDVDDIARFKQAELPFEALMEQIGRNLSMEDLLEVFNVAAPNRTHYLLVSLIEQKTGSIIYTTNFDSNIELAASNLGVNLTVVSLPTQMSVSEIGSHALIKLHGTIEDRSKLGVTIKTIASNKYIEGLEEWIKYLLVDGPHKNVLVLGYSFSDRFDIGPLMKKYASQSTKNVFNIEYDSSATGSQFESIVDGEFRYEQLKTDTDRWVNDAFRRFKIKDPGPNPVTNSFEAFVDKWFDANITNRGARNKFRTVVNLFKHIGLQDLVHKYATRGLESGVLDANALFGLYTAKAQSLNNYRSTSSELQESLSLLEFAIDYCKRSERPDIEEQLMFLSGTKGSINGSLGYKLKISGSDDFNKYYTQAKALLTESVEYFKPKISDMVCKDRYFGLALDLAAAYRRSGDVDRAVEYLDMIIAEYKEVSDLELKYHYLQAHYNYGIIYFHRADFSKALEYFNIALLGSIQIAMQQRAGYSLREAIVCMRKLGQADEARDMYERFPYPKPTFEYLWAYEIDLQA